MPGKASWNRALVSASTTSPQVGFAVSRTVSRSLTLSRERLVDLYGAEELLKARLRHLRVEFEDLKPRMTGRGIPLDEARHLLELAERSPSDRQHETDQPC